MFIFFAGQTLPFLLTLLGLQDLNDAERSTRTSNGNYLSQGRHSSVVYSPSTCLRFPLEKNVGFNPSLCDSFFPKLANGRFPGHMGRGNANTVLPMLLVPMSTLGQGLPVCTVLIPAEGSNQSVPCVVLKHSSSPAAGPDDCAMSHRLFFCPALHHLLSVAKPLGPNQGAVFMTSGVP